MDRSTVIKLKPSLGLSSLGLSIFFALNIIPAFAANDWNTPCFDGTCQYSLTAAPGQNGSGTMQIWGSSNAISDITSAAGWQILNCSATAMAQDIRLVCMSSDTEEAGCDHLFQAGGAEGKLVRLPENCGMSPFARVANAYISGDQSLPSNISARFVRRDGNGTSNSTVPQVHGLSLDANFSAVDPSKYGNVNIAIQGANYPGADVSGTLISTSASQRRTRLASRGLTDFVGNAISSLKDLNDVNVNKTIALPPVSVDKSATLLNKDIKCGNVDITVDLGVDGKASAQVSLGVAAQGTIVPPNLADFAVTVGMDALIDGTLDLNAGVSTTFDTGKIEVVPPLGIPGLDFPGILTIGPSFDVKAEATAKLDLAADLKVGIVYNISNAQLVFPDKDNQSGGNFNVGDTPLTLSLTPSVKSTGSLTAHLIPSLNLGVQALDNLASATVFLDLDASATMQLSLDAVDSNSITIDNGSSSNSTSSVTSSSSTGNTTTSNTTSSTAAAYYPMSSSTNSNSSSSSSSTTSDSSSSSASVVASQAAREVYGGYYYNLYKRSASATSTKPTSIPQAISSAKQASVSASSSATNVTSSSAAQATSASNGTSSSSTSTGNSTITSSSSGLQFGGCVEIDTGLAVNAGADGKFFDLFDASTQVPLFSKEFVLFKKCFGDGNATSSTSRRRAVDSAVSSLPHKSAPLSPRAAAAAPVASNSTASSSLACLASSAASPQPITGTIQIGAAT
ncbi:hypothetical protein EV361DRAFT_383525 [Lentinula raphanica]|nr:hypothetical protein EV361DRAFT_383525 [Lentinula raphanica]